MGEKAPKNPWKGLGRAPETYFGQEGPEIANRLAVSIIGLENQSPIFLERGVFLAKWLGDERGINPQGD